MTVSAAAREEVAALPEALRTSTLAAAVLDLAGRLDAGPTDRDATGLARELRITLVALQAAAAAATTEGSLDVGDAAMGH